MSLLEVSQLRTTIHTPRGDARVVDGVTLTVDQGQCLGIVGESGSGKTMLARSVLGLLPPGRVTRTGSVRLQDTDLLSQTAKQLCGVYGTQMSYVPQDPMTSLNPVRRIGDQLMEPLRTRLSLSRREACERALSLLESVRVPDPQQRMRNYPHELSGGMRQRVVIAAALACGPRLLFADEPTTALDVTIQAQILNLLDRMRRERDMTLVLVTHDLGVVAQYTDAVIVMYAGRIVERAPTPVLFKSMRMPYTRALLSATPSAKDPIHTRLTAIPGRPPDLVTPMTGCRFAARCARAQADCWEKEPSLRAGDVPGHEYRCWHPVDGPVTHAPTAESAMI
jgi:peptide/nickel transport system ATP-binding protein